MPATPVYAAAVVFRRVADTPSLPRLADDGESAACKKRVCAASPRRLYTMLFFAFSPCAFFFFRVDAATMI